MTPYARLLALRRQRGQHLAAIADGAASTRVEWHKQEAGRLSAKIKRLERKVRKEEARNNVR